MADPAVRKKAEELFVINGFSMDTILTMLAGEVSKKTLYNWRKEDNWGGKRINREVKTQNRIERLEALLDKYINEAETVSNPYLIFSIGKLIAALKSASSFEFTEEKKEKLKNFTKGWTKENLEAFEKESGLL
ncbi:MAG: hypothetical protein FIA82_00350 [Melioribacter sp.]|nr:hypothetical protein [Melioribacter sp.]